MRLDFLSQPPDPRRPTHVIRRHRADWLGALIEPSRAVPSPRDADELDAAIERIGSARRKVCPRCGSVVRRV